MKSLEYDAGPTNHDWLNGVRGYPYLSRAIDRVPLRLGVIGTAPHALTVETVVTVPIRIITRQKV